MIKLSIFQESYIARYIQISYFLILMMIREPHIQRCFNNMKIDMCTKISLPAQTLFESIRVSTDHVCGPYDMYNHEIL